MKVTKKFDKKDIKSIISQHLDQYNEKIKTFEIKINSVTKGYGMNEHDVTEFDCIEVQVEQGSEDRYVNKTKMKFPEYLARCESIDFKLDNGWLEHWKKASKEYSEILLNYFHEGDCTNIPCSCPLCLMEGLLKDYREFSFNPRKHLEDNGYEDVDKIIEDIS